MEFSLSLNPGDSVSRPLSRCSNIALVPRQRTYAIVLLQKSATKRKTQAGNRQHVSEGLCPAMVMIDVRRDDEPTN